MASGRLACMGKTAASASLKLFINGIKICQHLTEYCNRQTSK